VPKIIKSVEAIWRNGVRLTSEEFSHNKEFNTITVSELAADDRLEVYLTVETDHGNLRDLFSSVRGTVFFGSAEKSRNFFFGGTRSDTIFCSEHVAPADLDKACRIYDSDPLYLPEGNEFRIPEQRLPIQNVLRHKDNLLIFTEKDTWLAGGDSTGHTPLPSVLINSELGCLSPTGALLVQNDPITVGRHGLYRWESPDPALTHRDTVRISKALDFFLTTDDLSTATLFYDSMRDELLLNLPKRKELWICARKRQEWFCFHGITAERFFDADGQIGFFADDTVSIFDPTLSFDLDLDGGIKLISAVYESASFDFGTDAKKNLSEFSFCGDLDTGFLTLSVTTDTGENLSHTITDVLNREHASLTARMRSGRFQNATFELSHNGQYLPVIHSLSLTAH
ncbi:MAG: hypothetical protein IJD64_00885, partial [Clostridia bacterium]|nr:hypothetical protein [Clostridia bacterium]